MISGFIIGIYLTLVLATYIALVKTQVRSAGLSFGALIGLIYFLAIPMFFILIEGELYDPGINVDHYDPFVDYWTTFNIFVGWIVVLCAHLYERRLTVNRVDPVRAVDPTVVLILIFLFYFIISIYWGFSSGAFLSGRHWHDPSRFNSTSFLILKNFANCYRVVFFGGVLYLVESKRLSLAWAFLMGGSFCVLDMVVSFNRITAVYFIILCFLIFRRWRFVSVFMCVCIVPVVIRASGVWANFRGEASLNGYSMGGFVHAWFGATQKYDSLGNSLILQLNSIFESSNILVFHGLVKSVGDSFPVLYGETFILRPLTTFLPSTIWPDKPKVFGVYLGEFINSAEGLALNSTMFGEAYGNFLYLWPVFLFLALISFSWGFKCFDKVMPGVALMSVFIGVSLWRFDMNFAVVSLYSLFLIWGVVRVFFGRKFLVSPRGMLFMRVLK